MPSQATSKAAVDTHFAQQIDQIGAATCGDSPSPIYGPSRERRKIGAHRELRNLSTSIRIGAKDRYERLGIDRQIEPTPYSFREADFVPEYAASSSTAL